MHYSSANWALRFFVSSLFHSPSLCPSLLCFLSAALAARQVHLDWSQGLTEEKCSGFFRCLKLHPVGKGSLGGTCYPDKSTNWLDEILRKAQLFGVASPYIVMIITPGQ